MLQDGTYKEYTGPRGIRMVGWCTQCVGDSTTYTNSESVEKETQFCREQLANVLAQMREVLAEKEAMSRSY